ncbi:hypothetical protein HNQ77_002652 [Silvibacterium bohemicum]|uniref:Uncharacterized protein n=1 Tax=Silvibacterium bohemicum TaxID=1577686 RepID=A0A841JTN3_9BACT|nr:hypothetical protein [Silvibacterium bohemicum]MBB6144696.1 hypothetical protein [Silvibacterium bohemicum]
MATGNLGSSSRRSVVGYFSQGEDAQRAIDDLLTAGFRPSEIGAAFHSGAASSSSAQTIADEQELRPVVGPNAPGAGSTVSGAASDSSAVTPAGLSTGGGTVNSGADRPGPIPGAEIPSSIPSTLPHTIQSTLPSTLHPNPSAPLPSQGAVAYPSTGGFHEERKSGQTNWWEKLKHVFGGDSDSSRITSNNIVDKTSTNFGTGEGHIGILPEYDFAYSSAAFESAFFGMGIPSTHARQLSSRIARGGAIVTVDAGGLNADAEQILERNHGIVDYEEATPAATSTLRSEDAWEEANREGRVQLFGRVQSVYPGYVSSTGSAARKAS